MTFKKQFLLPDLLLCDKLILLTFMSVSGHKGTTLGCTNKSTLSSLLSTVDRTLLHFYTLANILVCNQIKTDNGALHTGRPVAPPQICQKVHFQLQSGPKMRF